jgi:hypothetical protein
MLDSRWTLVSTKWPCVVCRQGVGVNSILCRLCNRWVHKKCSGVVGKLKEMVGYKCPRCTREGGIDDRSDSGVRKELIIEQDVKFEKVHRFCYLGDMVGAGGGVDDASRARVRSGWKKFQDMAPDLRC